MLEAGKRELEELEGGKASALCLGDSEVTYLSLLVPPHVY